MDDPLLNDFNAIQCEDELLLLMDNVMNSLGIDGYLFTYAIYGWLPSGEPGDIQRWFSKGIDKKLLKGWLASGTNKVSDISRRYDPIRRYMVHQTIPHQFLLADIVNDKNNQYTLVQNRWFKALIKNDVVNLISIPVQLPPSEYWSLSLFSNNTLYKIDSAEKAKLMLFAHKLALHCIDVLHWREEGRKNATVKLRAREKDCLYWSAQGKTAAETAAILGLQTETIRKYIKNAMKRMNVRSQPQAVVKAIELGLLNINMFQK